MFIGGLLTIIIIASIGGYFAYQYYAEDIEPTLDYKEIDLSYDQWEFYYNTEKVKFYTDSENLIIEDNDRNNKMKATLHFKEIVIGKVNLYMRNDEVWNKQMFIFFEFGKNERAFQILRLIDGSYWFGVKPIGLSFYDGDDIFHNYYIEWDFSGDTKIITAKFDDKIILDHYVLTWDITAVDRITLNTYDHHEQSLTYINLQNSYLRDYTII